MSDIAAVSRQAFSQWWTDNTGRLSAALAYYSVFSLAPMLVIAIAVAGFVFGEEAARGEIFRQMSALIGNDGAKAVQGMLQNAYARKESGLIASAVSVVALALGATAVFGELQNGLNTVWEVATRPGTPYWRIINNRLISFAMVLTIGFLLLVSLVLSAGLSAMGAFFRAWLPVAPEILELMNLLLSFTVITALFAAIYKILPDVYISWKDVWVGAAVSSLLFSLGKSAIGLYLGRSSATSAYGAAGSLVLILLWAYYSAQIFYLGAEFTEAYANRYGKHMIPKPHAMPLRELYASTGEKPTAGHTMTASASS